MAFQMLQGYYQTWADSVRESFRTPLTKPKPLLVTSVVGVVGVLGVRKLWRSTNKPLPPGARGWPLLGNLLDLTDDEIHEDFLRIQSKYNLPDIFTLSMGPTSKLIVLNSFDVIKDAFVTQGDSFANRPQTLLPTTDLIMFKDYLDPTWSEGKAFVMSALRSTGFGCTKGTEEKILEQVERLQNYLDPAVQRGGPIDIQEILPLASANIIFEILFNKNYSFDDEELLRRIKLVVAFLPVAGQTVALDYLPRWFGTIFFRKTLQKFNNAMKPILDFIMSELVEHKSTLDPDNPRDFVDIYLSKAKGSVDMEALRDTIFTLLPDSIDTIGSLFTWILLYLAHFPKVQKRVQEEIVALTGGNRRITWADRPILPYSEAVIMEVMRVVCPVLITLLHCPIRDDAFRGYHIPKGTPMVANLYAASRDMTLFTDPEEFNPDRFIDNDGNVTKRDSIIPFGLGRRKCLGEQIVKIETFLLITNLLQRYDFSFVEGEPPPSLEPMDFTIVRAPKPFKLTLKYRQI